MERNQRANFLLAGRKAGRRKRQRSYLQGVDGQKVNSQGSGQNPACYGTIKPGTECVCWIKSQPPNGSFNICSCPPLHYGETSNGSFNICSCLPLHYGETSKEDPTHQWVLHSTSLQGSYSSLLGWSFPSVLSPPLHTLHLQTLACYPKSSPYRVAFKQKRAHKTRDPSVVPPGAAALR